MAEHPALEILPKTPPAERAHRSTWAVGFTAFAACIMIALGLFQAMAGFVTLFNNSLYATNPDYLFEFERTPWGFAHILLGILLVAAGLGLFLAQVWARIVGVALAIISALAAFAFVPYYPIWALTLLALAIAVVWALTVHGEDIITA